MEDLEKWLDDGAPKDTGEGFRTGGASQSRQWCASCRRSAKEMEEQYAQNFIAIKQKIFFTDNLIQMYQTTKKQLEEVTDKFNQANRDKSLVQSQLELILSKDQPSYAENEKLNTMNKELEDMVKGLKEQLYGMDESRRIHEETIKVLKAEDSSLVLELKKKHTQQISELRKELAEKIDDNRKLVKKNKDLQDRVDRLRDSRKRLKKSTGQQHKNESRKNTLSPEIPSKKLIELKGNFSSNFLTTDGVIKTEESESETRVRGHEGPKILDKILPERETVCIGVITSTSSDDVGEVEKDIFSQGNKTKTEKKSMNSATEALEAESQENKESSEDRAKKAYSTFLNDPKNNQNYDLLTMAKEWKMVCSKRPALRKKDAIQVLLSSVSAFCGERFLLGHEDIILERLYKLHKNMFSERNRKWLKSTAEKATKGAPTNQGRTKILKSVNLFGASVNTDFESNDGMRDSVSDMHCVTDKEEHDCLGFSENGNFVSEMCDISRMKTETSYRVHAEEATCIDRKDSNSLGFCSNMGPCEQKCRASKESAFEASVKTISKAPKDHMPAEARRRTRSMAASGSSDQEGTKITVESPVRRSRRISARRRGVFESADNDSQLTSSPHKTQSLKMLMLNEKPMKKRKISADVKTTTFKPPHGFQDYIGKKSPSRLSDFDQTQSEKVISGTLINIQNSLLSTHFETDYVLSESGWDLLDIINEMSLPLKTLSPLPKSPSVAEERNVDVELEASQPSNLFMGSADDGKMSQTAGQDLTNEASKGRSSISPSTDLCTAINFATLSDGESRHALAKLNDISDSDMLQASDHELLDHARETHGKVSLSFEHSTNILTQDIFKPRRFSCEAPEQAVTVLPIKPISKASFNHMKLPVQVTANNEVGKTMSLPPHRKDGDIPSHWHSSVPQVIGDRNSNNKIPPVDSTALASNPFDEVNKQEKTPAVQGAAEYGEASDCDTDAMLNNMTGVSPLLSALESESDDHHRLDETIEANVLKSGSENECKSVASNAKHRTSHTLEEEATNWEKTVMAELNSNKESVAGDSTDSCAEGRSLIMDVPDVENRHGNNSVVKSSENRKESSNLIPCQVSMVSVWKENFKAVDQSLAVEQPKVIMEKPEKRKETAPIDVLEGETDHLTQAYETCTKGARVEINDKLVLHNIVAFLKDTKVELDLFQDDGDAISLRDLPLGERTFSRQMCVLHKAEVGGASFLSKRVIPLLLKILQRYGSLYCGNTQILHDDIHSILLPVLTPDKYGWVLSLPKMMALMRVFFIVSKLVNASSPAYTLCRYHLIWNKGSNMMISLLQGLLCWPRFLNNWPSLGRTVLQVIRKLLNNSQILKNRKKIASLKTQLDWINNKCGWLTNSDHHPGASTVSLPPDILDDAMSRVASAEFTAEFKTFLEEIKECRNDVSPPIPVFHQETIIGIQILELLPRETVVEQIKAEIIDRQFWPLLNSWSQHIHIHGDVEEGREVSNACAVAILEALAHMVSSYLLRQRQMHKSQPTTPGLQTHFKVICGLMHSLSTLYLHKAPKLVQCATVCFLLRTCFCNPPLAHSSLLEWAKVTSEPSTMKARHRDLGLLIVLSGCCEQSLKNICNWLDITEGSSEKSLVSYLWPR